MMTAIVKVGVLQFPKVKTMGEQRAQGLCEITLREEFVKMNELTGIITLSSGILYKQQSWTRAWWTALKGKWYGITTRWHALKC
jgi:hypothetical protein